MNDTVTHQIVDAGRQARVDLAAVYRLLASHGWGGVMRGRADVMCSVHVHPEEGIAIPAMKRGPRPLSQNAMRFHNRTGYHEYKGLTGNFSERERIIAPLRKNHALIMFHHGITTVGETAREAFSLVKEFVRAARIRIMMEFTGQDVPEIPAAMCKHVAAQYEKHDKGRAPAEWPAYLRQLDALDPGYRA